VFQHDLIKGRNGSPNRVIGDSQTYTGLMAGTYELIVK